MLVDDFKLLLQRPDVSFVDAIESEEFQSMLMRNFDFYAALDGWMQWRLLYGLWAVLLDFSGDPEGSWQPSKVTVPGLPSSLSLQDVLQALVVADFEVRQIDWSDESGCDPDADYDLYDQALHSEECRQLVQFQIEAGLRRVLSCDFSRPPAQVVVERKAGLLRKVLSALVTLLGDRMPALRSSTADRRLSHEKSS